MAHYQPCNNYNYYCWVIHQIVVQTFFLHTFFSQFATFYLELLVYYFTCDQLVMCCHVAKYHSIIVLIIVNACSGTVQCNPGLIVFEGKCYTKCPDGSQIPDQSTFHQNRTTDQQLVRDVVSVCVRCGTLGNCSDSFQPMRWLLIAAVSAVCLAGVLVLLIFALKHFMCKQIEYEALPCRRSHFHIVDVIGLHDKHLLSSDSDSSDELAHTAIVDVENSSKVEIS